MDSFNDEDDEEEGNPYTDLQWYESKVTKVLIAALSDASINHQYQSAWK